MLCVSPKSTSQYQVVSHEPYHYTEYLLAELFRRRLWNAAIWHMQLLSREICIPATAETKVMTSTVNKETNSISCFMISRLSAGLERLEDNKARRLHGFGVMWKRRQPIHRMTGHGL
jgi:hypothetical protein